MTKSPAFWLFCLPVLGMSASGFFHGVAHGQQATVTGVVVERSQNAWIGGATVRLSGSPPYFTDLDGAFQFTGVAAGRHMLTVRALGYQAVSMEVVVRADTALVIEMDPDPVVLDSLLVRAGEVTIRGEILDALTGLPVLHGQVTVQPDMSTVGAVSGRFTVRRVPVGRPVTVLVEALEYMPARIALITDSDTTLSVRLDPDPVAILMAEQQLEVLEVRSNSVAMSKEVMDREDMALTPGWTVFDMVRIRLGEEGRRWSDPRTRIRRHACLFIDEVNVWYPDFLRGLTAEEVERVEIYGRGRMIRVYTKRFLFGMLRKEPGTMAKFKWGLIDPNCRR